MGAFVVSAGQLAKLDRAPTGLQITSVRLTDDFTQDYAAIYRTNPQVRTVISFLARNTAQIKLPLFRRKSDTDREKLTDHPLAALIKRPNPRMTRYRMFDALVNDLGIWDNSVWAKVKIGGQTKALLRLPPNQVEPIGEAWMWPEGYRFKGNKGHRDFTPEEVVHFRGFNPTDARWGVSPLETLRRILAEDYQAGLSREKLHRNGAQFAGVIERPMDAPEWSDPAAKQFAQDFHAAWSSSGSQAGGTPILEDGMKYVANGVSPKDLQYIEARKLTREEIAAAFHIPLPMVQLLEHATFSNIQEQHKQLYQDTLGPLLQMIQEDLELQLIPDFDSTGKLYLEFNMAEKMKGSLEEQSESYYKASGGPWLTTNEVRAKENLAPVEGGEKLLRPLNHGGGDNPAPAEDPPEPDVPADEQKAAVRHVLRKFAARQRVFALSALGAKSGWWPAARWDTELSADLAVVGVKNADAAARMVNGQIKSLFDTRVAGGSSLADFDLGAYPSVISDVLQHITFEED